MSIRKRTLYVLGIALTSGVLAACGETAGGFTERSTEVAAQIFATQTAAPTATPTITPTPLPDLAALLTLRDLPPNFVKVPQSSTNVSFNDFGLSIFDKTESFYFNYADVDDASNARLEVIIGFTAILDIDSETKDFEALLDTATLGLSVSESLNANLNLFLGEVAQVAPLPHLSVGDESAAITATLTDGEVTTLLDIMLFRRGDVAATIAIFYFDPAGLAVQIGDIASVIDRRLTEGY